MKPQEIKAELIRKNLTLTGIADALGCTIQEVSMCISGGGLYQKIRDAIAAHLEKPVNEVFNDPAHPSPKRKKTVTVA